MFQLFELYSIELYSTGSKSTIVVTSSGTVSLNTSDTLKSLRLEVEARYAFGSTLVSFSQCNVCLVSLDLFGRTMSKTEAGPTEM